MSSSTVLRHVLIISIFALQVLAGGLQRGIHYRIRNGYDGNVLTASSPTYKKDLTLKLGAVNAQPWEESGNQLWSVHTRPTTSDNGTSQQVLYWLKPMKSVLNIITGIPGEKEVQLELTEITENSATFTIRNPDHGLCLENQGIGLEITYRACNELNAAQQWDFDDPTNNLKFYIDRIVSRIYDMFTNI